MVLTPGNGIQKMAKRIVIESEMRAAKSWLEWYERTYIEPGIQVPEQTFQDLQAQYGKVDVNMYMAVEENINGQLWDDLEKLAYKFDGYVKRHTGKSPIEEEGRWRADPRQGNVDFGDLYILDGAHTKMMEDPRDMDIVNGAISRFDNGDWGFLDAEAAAQNERENRINGVLIGTYSFVDGSVFVIIRGRPSRGFNKGTTNVMLPEEYRRPF